MCDSYVFIICVYICTYVRTYVGMYVFMSLSFSDCSGMNAGFISVLTPGQFCRSRFL